MERAQFYWTVVAGVIGAGWIIMSVIRDRISQSLERTNAIIDRLIEVDKLIITNPDIQKYISENSKQKEEYFRNESLLKEEIFYKAKTLVYMQLNAFDEILSMASQTSKRYSFLKPGSIIEISDWEQYIILKLRHPLYGSILNNEKEIFGISLRNFWEKHKREIESTSINPFVW